MFSYVYTFSSVIDPKEHEIFHQMMQGLKAPWRSLKECEIYHHFILSFGFGYLQLKLDQMLKKE